MMAEEEANKVEARISVWCNPPETTLPLRSKTFRFAVGTPHGLSSNSWKIWVQNKDVYIACRDNFKDMKVSLHASGTWRLGFTEQAIRDRPDILQPGQDRTWKKWTPSLEQDLIVAFQLIVPPVGCYLGPEQRRDWPPSVLFIEPEVQGLEFVAINVAIARTLDPVHIAEGTRAIVLGAMPLDKQRSVQVVATYEPAESLANILAEGLARIKQVRASSPKDSETIFMFGNRSDDSTWVSALPAQLMERASEIVQTHQSSIRSDNSAECDASKYSFCSSKSTI